MERKLYRNTQEGALSGVCAGLGDYLQVDKVWIRLIFVFSIILSPLFGFGVLGAVLYVILWVVLPVKLDAMYNVDYRVSPGGSVAVGDRTDDRRPKGSGMAHRTVIGLVLLIAGVLLLLYQLDVFQWYNITRFWPVILIIGGLAIIGGAFRKEKRDPPSEGPVQGPDSAEDTDKSERI